MISFKLFILGHMLGGLGYTAVFELLVFDGFNTTWNLIKCFVLCELRLTKTPKLNMVSEVAAKLLFWLAKEQNLLAPFLS